MIHGLAKVRQSKWGVSPEVPYFDFLRFFSLSFWRLVIKVFFFSSLSCGTAFAGTSGLLVAHSFISAIQSRDLENIERLEGDVLRAQLKGQQLIDLWSDLERRLGYYKGCQSHQIEKRNPYEIITLTCSFGQNKVDFSITTDKSLIFGFFILRTYLNENSSTSNDAYSEKDIIFGEKEWLLPGTLTLPAQKHPLAALVLVHGSGPLDRNETVGQTHLFADLSSRLAQKGVATFRYDKRTFHYSIKLAAESDVTLEDESITDARLALKEVRKQLPDTKCVFLVGHSLGAYLAPVILSHTHHAQGMILLAPPGRKMVDVMLDQVEFLRSLSEENRNGLASVQERLKAMKESNNPTGSMAPGFWGKSAWEFFQHYSPLDEWKKNNLDTLVIFAKKDYQVTSHDALAWEGLRKNYPEKIEISQLEGLGHTFSPVSGPPSPQSYMQSSEASDEVINLIADFIRSKCI